LDQEVKRREAIPSTGGNRNDEIVDKTAGEESETEA
jgi:hypothetical protein